MRKGQAQMVFNEELARVGTSTEYNDFSIYDEAHREAWQLDYWRQDHKGQGETARTLAYFRAYLRIAKNDQPIGIGDPLTAGGIRIEPKGRVRMDKYVIGTLHTRGFLRFEQSPGYRGEPAFLLTETGKNWIDQT